MKKMSKLYETKHKLKEVGVMRVGADSLYEGENILDIMYEECAMLHESTMNEKLGTVFSVNQRIRELKNENLILLPKRDKSNYDDTLLDVENLDYKVGANVEPDDEIGKILEAEINNFFKKKSNSQKEFMYIQNRMYLNSIISNSVKEIEYVVKNLGDKKNKGEIKSLTPLRIDNNHWVGLTVEYDFQKKKYSYQYMNSLGVDNKQPLVEDGVQNEFQIGDIIDVPDEAFIKMILDKHNVKDEIAEKKGFYIQNNGSDCGPCTIENLLMNGGVKDPRIQINNKIATEENKKIRIHHARLTPEISDINTPIEKLINLKSVNKEQKKELSSSLENIMAFFKDDKKITKIAMATLGEELFDLQKYILKEISEIKFNKDIEKFVKNFSKKCEQIIEKVNNEEELILKLKMERKNRINKSNTKDTQHEINVDQRHAAPREKQFEKTNRAHKHSNTMEHIQPEISMDENYVDAKSLGNIEKEQQNGSLLILIAKKLFLVLKSVYDKIFGKDNESIKFELERESSDLKNKLNELPTESKIVKNNLLKLVNQLDDLYKNGHVKEPQVATNLMKQLDNLTECIKENEIKEETLSNIVEDLSDICKDIKSKVNEKDINLELISAKSKIDSFLQNSKSKKAVLNKNIARGKGSDSSKGQKIF